MLPVVWVKQRGIPSGIISNYEIKEICAQFTLEKKKLQIILWIGNERGENKRIFLLRGHTSSNCPDGMICLEAPYFNLNEILLRAIGLWPFQRTKLGQIHFSLILSVITTTIIFQVRQ